MHKLLRAVKALKQRRWLVLGLVLSVAAVILYLIISLLAVSRTEILLEKLYQSFLRETVCHEDCAAEREELSRQLIGELRSQTAALNGRHLEEYFLDESRSDDFRIALLAIISRVDEAGGPPEYVLKYLDNGRNIKVRAAILSMFDALLLSSENNPLDFYYKIIMSSDSLELKLGAVGALSSRPDRADYFDKGQLAVIKKVIFNAGADKRLRWPLVLLLSDYYDFFPEEVVDILSVYYTNSIDGDSISRAFAADSLNRLAGLDVEVPEVGGEAWAEYYDN